VTRPPAPLKVHCRRFPAESLLTQSGRHCELPERAIENAAKQPKREASALVLLILEFFMIVLPRIDKLGRRYSIPSGASGRNAAKQAAVEFNPETFIAKHLPNYPYYHVANPNIRALQTNVQGIWSSETKHKAMEQFTVPEGLRILVICPEIFYRRHLDRDANLAVAIRDANVWGCYCLAPIASQTLTLLSRNSPAPRAIRACA
jgi:hypothetical protein